MSCWGFCRKKKLLPFLFRSLPHPGTWASSASPHTCAALSASKSIAWCTVAAKRARSPIPMPMLLAWCKISRHDWLVSRLGLEPKLLRIWYDHIISFLQFIFFVTCLYPHPAPSHQTLQKITSNNLGTGDSFEARNEDFFLPSELNEFGSRKEIAVMCTCSKSIMAGMRLWTWI